MNAWSLLVDRFARCVQVGKVATGGNDFEHFDDLEFVVAQGKLVPYLWSLIEVLDTSGVRATLDYKTHFVDHSIHLHRRYFQDRLR